MATDYFLKLEKIEGESEDAVYKNQIQLKSWGWSAIQVPHSAQNGGLAAGKVDPKEFSFSTLFDKSTCQFFNSICAGTHIPSGTLSAVKAGDDKKKPYFTVAFKEIFVTDLTMACAAEIPTVNLSFSYAELAMEYCIQDDKGKLASTGPVKYNRRTNIVE
jgi:type VI secretion system secreted protein Hcp